MAEQTPLFQSHQAEAERVLHERAAHAEAHRPGASLGGLEGAPAPEYIPWGPQDAEAEEASSMLATLGSVEAEYAMLRRRRGRIDDATRGTIHVRGADAADFLDRMLTQKLAGFAAGDVAASFLTDRKGRILAELLLAGTDDGILIDVDVHQVDVVVETLDGFLFSEDVQLENVTSAWYRLGVHGPAAPELFDESIGPMRGSSQTVDGCAVHVVRRDRIGSPGFLLFVRRDDAATIWQALDCGTSAWYAFNMARIEAGTPLCNIDFGPGSLPHETTLVPECVSFTKGCYPGQEIVARMQHLGQPSQVLRGLRLQGDALPVAGSQVMAIEDGGGMGQPIGVVTSSSLSPMLGSTPLALAMLRTKKSEPGVMVRVHDEGEPCDAVVGPLAAWPIEQEGD